MEVYLVCELTKKHLYIIGAGGLGREIESWLEQEPEIQATYKIQGYLDRNKDALSGYPAKYDILGDPLQYEYPENSYCIMAIAGILFKEEIFLKLKGRVEFLTFVSKFTVIGNSNKIGYGSIVLPRVTISTNVNIGIFNTINVGTQIGHDSKIGDFSSIMAQVEIGGECEIGNKIFIGSNATIIPRRSIVDECRVGAGSVVVRDIKEKCTVFGNLAKKLL